MEHPVAQVVVDTPLAHLDRPFDYAVTPEQDLSARPGVRVRVRFAGRLVNGYLLARTAASEHTGRLAPLHAVVSPEPVAGPDLLRLARAVADRYAGTLPDVLRLAIPPRAARVEAETPAPVHHPTLDPAVLGADTAGWPSAAPLLSALAGGAAPRAVWVAAPGRDWAADLTAMISATVASGRGAVLVCPDGRDVARAAAPLRARLGADAVVALTADLGPSERYRRWLRARRGSARVVVGTRAAAFAPVADLGLVAVWEDDDDTLAEPRAPYPHARDVLVLRAHLAGCAAVLGSVAPSVEAWALVARGWARPLDASPGLLRARAPRVDAAGSDTDLARDPAARTARLPSLAWSTARSGLEAGPVLVSVARAGYQPGLACAHCRAPARCPACTGPLSRTPAGGLVCARCGRTTPPGPGGDIPWTCPQCGGTRLRVVAVGAGRTVEELGRAFPGVPVTSSTGERMLDTVAATPALVVATAGAEPRADGGYAAALLLDGAAQLARPDLRAGEQTLRRWLGVVGLVRPAERGGRVVVVAESTLPAVQALLRLDPAGFAEREASERAALGFPPATRMAELTGSQADLTAAMAELALPPGTTVLGPLPVGTGGSPPTPEGPAVGEHSEAALRLVLRVPAARGGDLATALHTLAAARSARRLTHIGVRLDPRALG